MTVTLNVPEWMDQINWWWVALGVWCPAAWLAVGLWVRKKSRQNALEPGSPQEHVAALFALSAPVSALFVPTIYYGHMAIAAFLFPGPKKETPSAD